MKFRTQWWENGAARIIFRVVKSGLQPSAGIACIGLALGCGSGLMPVQQSQLSGSQQQLSEKDAQNTLYNIQDLGVFGPNPSAPGGPLVVTNSGWISGAAGVGPGGTGPEHAVLYYRGNTIDVGNPGLGGNSMGYGVNESGVTAGEAENTAAGLATTEDFCGFQFLGFSSSATPCVAFVWRNGQMVSLPTLGGVNGSATEINNSGMIGGYAETTTVDPNCSAPQKYQFKPVVWDHGAVQALPTGDDADGGVLAVNDRGDAAGATGSCAPLNPILLLYLNPTHALLWHDGVAIDLGNLGGEFNNLPHGMNNLGQVVGESDLAGDQTAHAFLASAGTKMQDLGTVGNDTYSFGFGINDAGDIVGISANADFSVIRAFIRRNGTLVDLNTLVTGTNPFPNGTLLTACFINSKGEITGIALDSTGAEHTYLATPVHSASSTKANVRKPVVLPDWIGERFRAAFHSGL
jgi:probable HAF family extracellular repeat protein